MSSTTTSKFLTFEGLQHYHANLIAALAGRYTLTAATNSTAGADIILTDNLPTPAVQQKVNIRGTGAASVTKDSTGIKIDVPTPGNGTLTIQAGPNSADTTVLGTFTANQSGPTTVTITPDDLGLESALHFLGVSSTAITDGGSELPTIDGDQVTPSNGDIVIYGNKEFVWSTADNQWHKFGDTDQCVTSITSSGDSYVSITQNTAATGAVTLNVAHLDPVVPTGATQTLYKMTVDAKGHIASKTAAVASDIPTTVAITRSGGVSGHSTYDTTADPSETVTVTVNGVADSIKLTIASHTDIDTIVPAHS